MKSILKNNLDDIPDGFKEYSLNLNLDKNKIKHMNNINKINKNLETQYKKKEPANKINLLADYDINSKQKLDNNLNHNANSDFNFNSSSNKIIFLLILFLLESCA